MTLITMLLTVCSILLLALTIALWLVIHEDGGKS